MPFTVEELAEIRLADEEIEASFHLTESDKEIDAWLDGMIKLDRMDPKSLKRHRYNKKYYEARKNKISDRRTAHYSANKNSIKAYQLDYYNRNKERVLSRNAAYAADHKDKVSSYQSDYYRLHRDDIIAKKAAIRAARRITV